MASPNFLMGASDLELPLPGDEDSKWDFFSCHFFLRLTNILPGDQRG